MKNYSIKTAQSSYCNVLHCLYYKDSFVLHFNIWSNVLYSTELLENMLWSLTVFNTLLKYVTCTE